jgi:cytochrome P450
VTYDFFSYDTVVDPYPTFDRLREQDPVFATNFGYWYVSRYEDANRLLRDGSLGAGRRPHLEPREPRLVQRGAPPVRGEALVGGRQP